MKKLAYFLVVLVVFTSCSKKDSEVGPENTAAGLFCKIDGKDYAPDFSYAYSVFDGTFGIYGLDSRTNAVVWITLPQKITTGTHSLSGKGYEFRGDYTLGTVANEQYSTIVEVGSGSVTIDKITDTQVIGSFNFTGVNNNGTKRTVSEGKFNVMFRL